MAFAVDIDEGTDAVADLAEFGRFFVRQKHHRRPRKAEVNVRALHFDDFELIGFADVDHEGMIDKVAPEVFLFMQ
jgi:hypothetical protein